LISPITGRDQLPARSQNIIMKEGRTNIIEQAPVEVAQSGPGKGKGGK